MSRVSYTVEGFRAAFRRPLLTWTEITWRWTVGATAAALAIFALLEYLDSLPLTDAEMLFLRTKQPFLVDSVIAHILRGSLHRVVLAGLLVSLALIVLWIVAASLGRAVTVRGLLDYFAARKDGGDIAVALVGSAGGRDAAGNVTTVASSESSFAALMRLNFLRAALGLAAICGFFGAAIVAGFASPAADPQPALAFLLFLPLAGLVGWVWSSLNWLLSLASVFAVRDGEDTIGAISAAVAFCRERTGPVFAVSTWTGLAHLGFFAGATTVVSVFLGLAAIVPWRLVVAAIILVTLTYFVVADWLYMARLAGYVSILETPEPAPVPALVPPSPPGGPVTAVKATIDFEEPIISDISNLALET
jgi:hypothetical protein